jgi:hypothetical protein
MTPRPGGVRVALAHNARTRAHVAAILDRLTGAAADYLAIPASIGDDGGDALALDYAVDGASLAEAPEAGAHTSPAARLPALLELATYLAVCVRHLARIEVPALISPACLRRGAPGARPWRLLVVPLVDVGLADWAQAAPAAWRWTPADVLLGRATSPGAYAVGAALVEGLVGELFPAGTPPTAQLRRALRGWIGSRPRLTAALDAALPASFVDERAALAALCDELLAPQPPAGWEARLGELAAQLAPHRTAARWEYEGDLATARTILERMATTRPAEAVPWDVVARVRGLDHDLDGALAATLEAVSHDPDAVRELAAICRRIAHVRGDAARPLLERALAAVDRLGHRLGDAGRLHFAHLEARHLGRLAAAEARLAAPMAAPWDNVLRAIVLARIHAERRTWPHVARLCKEARAATVAMPQAGGGLGAYVVAFLDHLDGVAHHGASRQYRDEGYLGDAFAKLAAALDGARALGDDDLAAASAGWLRNVAALATELGMSGAAMIGGGVDACLAGSGLTATAAAEEGTIVWYDASRLLALSGAP